MYEVLQRDALAPGLTLLRIKAPDVAMKMQPGQFVIARADDRGERIPLSVADWDDESVSLVVQDVGVSTRKLSLLSKGSFVLNLVGPLGKPSQIANFGTVVIVSGCFGTGPGFALARALKQAGNKVISIVEARNSDWLFWLDRLERISDRLIVTCNRASSGDSCATNPLKRILGSENVDRVYAIGCTFMMMEISKATEPDGIPTRVNLMPLMVDGTGMCGACRCIVEGRTMLGCVDGPEFDGHRVDWYSLVERMRSYLDEETDALDIWDRENWHRAADRKGMIDR
ncbi:MAG: sulfide/dihydroorotate dehydrogenase-like FAD/NAD-binding protein [Methanothrix sp.]|nr:sulfide/dihydroorotate dehydrogenase-like FAD/NAD-binding protein [Methanothrix sp.]